MLPKRSTGVNLLLVPALIGSLGLYLLPGLASGVLAFTNYGLRSAPEMVGFANFAELFSDPLFWHSLKITLLYTIFVVPTFTVVPLLVAIILSRAKYRSLFSIIYLLPMVISPVAQAFIWIWLFNPEYGLLNKSLTAVGLPAMLWLYDTRTALLSLCIMSLWGFGVNAMIFLAALKSVPDSLLKMAQIDHATSWQTIRRIILPHLYPIIIFVVGLSFVQSMQVFYPAYLMTDGGPQNATLFHMLYVFRNAFIYNKMGYACAIATVFALVMAILTYGGYRYYQLRLKESA